MFIYSSLFISGLVPFMYASLYTLATYHLYIGHINLLDMHGMDNLCLLNVKVGNFMG